MESRQEVKILRKDEKTRNFREMAHLRAEPLRRVRLSNRGMIIVLAGSPVGRSLVGARLETRAFTGLQILRDP